MHRIGTEPDRQDEIIAQLLVQGRVSGVIRGVLFVADEGCQRPVIVRRLEQIRLLPAGEALICRCRVQLSRGGFVNGALDPPAGFRADGFPDLDVRPRHPNHRSVFHQAHSPVAHFPLRRASRRHLGINGERRPAGAAAMQDNFDMLTRCQHSQPGSFGSFNQSIAAIMQDGNRNDNPN